jgi:uncharacterized membrane-anchored protein
MKYYPQSNALHNEVHARPPEPMGTPLAITHIVMLADAAGREASRAHLAALMRDHHQPPPDPQASHLRADLGAFRLRWELHTEFVTYTFFQPLERTPHEDQELPRAVDVAPQAWLAALPGECLCSMHLWALTLPAPQRSALARRHLREESLIGSSVADGHAEIYTDLALHADGYSRALVFADTPAEDGMSPRRLGRLVQRILEIETYRMVALLGLPTAREATALLSRGEAELASLAQAIRTAQRDQEPELLDRLTRLAGEVESHYAATHSRFSASSAYFDLINRRIAEIAETRLAGLQSIKDFMDRRLTPAMNTCDWARRRQQALSERISRMSNLLRTRVEIEQQQSSQALLATMNQRQDLQLKLQTTVEGLSVAAITYYMVGLIAYLAKGAKVVGWPLSAEITSALAVPLVAFGVWWSLRKLHHKIVGDQSHEA